MGPAMRLGEFIVQASNQSAGSNAFRGYATTFHPSVATLADATIISLKSGDERTGADVQVHPVTMRPVSGSVVGPNGPEPNFAVHLIPEYAASQPLERTFAAAVTASGANGTFVFPAVPPGQYVLKAWRLPQVLSIGRDAMPPDTTLWGEMPVSVGETPVAGLAIGLHPGAVLAGHVEFNGSAPMPMPAQIQTFISRSFEPPWPLALGNMMGSRVSAQGDFVVQGQPPGKYFANFANAFVPQRWYLESATLNGKDLITSPFLVEGGPVNGIALTFTDHRTEVTGLVQNARGDADADAGVLVFPADYRTWMQNGLPAQAAHLVSPSQTGMYSIVGLPPAEYLFVAAPEDMLTNWRRPETIEVLATQATRVALARGDVKHIDLRTRRMP